jgi:hypothetical protein
MRPILRKAAEAALVEWHSGQWDRQSQCVDDLTNDLWVWYLKRPETRRKMQGSEPFQAQRMAFKAALQTLSEQQLQSDTFHGRSLYSSESIKEALKGKSTNKYLRAILPTAMADLDKRYAAYAEALRKRYEDGVIPADKKTENLLMRAHKSLTEEVNVNYITSDVEGIGSRSVVFPETRRSEGGYSDPTGDIAVMLIENPDVRDEYLDPTPVDQWVNGKGAEPALDLGNGRWFRPPVRDYNILRKHPQLVGIYLDNVRKRHAQHL